MGAFDVEQYWQAEGEAHLAAAQATFGELREPFTAMLAATVAAVRAGGKLLFFGNGGSAADAQHLATELTIRYVRDRLPIAAIALTTDTSALTAAGNDLGFDRVFARQVEALVREGDVAIGLSTSGNSQNVILGLAMARDKGAVTVGLTGIGGGRMADLCDHLIAVPSSTTARIQEMHITLGHLLCGALERELGLV
ncbi:MAG: D-sedoheptulose 7-phosphate isomerase [Pseudomonadota bacterium]